MNYNKYIKMALQGKKESVLRSEGEVKTCKICFIFQCNYLQNIPLLLMLLYWWKLELNADLPWTWYNGKQRNRFAANSLWQAVCKLAAQANINEKHLVFG